MTVGVKTDENSIKSDDRVVPIKTKYDPTAPKTANKIPKYVANMPIRPNAIFPISGYVGAALDGSR